MHIFQFNFFFPSCSLLPVEIETFLLNSEQKETSEYFHIICLWVILCQNIINTVLTNVEVSKYFTRKFSIVKEKISLEFSLEFLLSNPFFFAIFSFLFLFFLFLRVRIVFCRKSFRFFILVIFRLFTLRFFGFCIESSPIGGVKIVAKKIGKSSTEIFVQNAISALCSLIAVLFRWVNKKQCG